MVTFDSDVSGVFSQTTSDFEQSLSLPLRPYSQQWGYTDNLASSSAVDMQVMFQTMLQFIEAQLAHLHTVNKQHKQNKDYNQDCHQNHCQFSESQIIQNDNLKSLTKTEWFHLSNLEFFDSLYMSINTQNGKPIIISEKEVIYRDIHTFIEKV